MDYKVYVVSDCPGCDRVMSWLASHNVTCDVINIQQDQVISRTKLLHQLVQSLYSRTEAEFKNGSFRIKGDTVDIFPGYANHAYRIHFFGDEIEDIEAFDVQTTGISPEPVKPKYYSWSDGSCHTIGCR